MCFLVKEKKRQRDSKRTTKDNYFFYKVLCSLISNQAATLQRIPRWNRSEYVV